MSKITFLDAISVQLPCSESWDEMQGGEQIRFCSHCAKSVHNLSKMTRKQARKIVAESNGSICVRYTRRPDGRIQTIKKTLHQITRQTGIAAGVLGTSLSVSTLVYAQTTPEQIVVENDQIVRVSDDKSDSPIGKITGTITDQDGALIPFAFVTLMNEKTNFYQSANADQEGVYEFKDVPRGEYKMKIDAGGFSSREVENVSISGAEQNYNAHLVVANIGETVTVSCNDEQDITALGGTMISISYRNGLVAAVAGENFDEVKVRVAMGERVNAKDKSYGNNSPLHVAVENGNFEIAEFLLLHGAKTNSRNADKRTVLMMLDEDATPELVNLLLRFGAKINLADKEGNTALMFAAEYASNEVMQTLINAGANANAINKKGETALMRAADGGELENVKFLLGAGAGAQLKNKKGENALSLTSDADIKQILFAYGSEN